MENVIIVSVIVLSAIWIYLDATQNKIGRLPSERDFFNISAGAWSVCTLALWIVAFPAYLIKRTTLCERAKCTPIEVRWRAAKTATLSLVGGLWILLSYASMSGEVGVFHTAIPRCNAPETLELAKSLMKDSAIGFMAAVNDSSINIATTREQLYDPTLDARACSASVSNPVSASDVLNVLYTVEWQDTSKQTFLVTIVGVDPDQTSHDNDDNDKIANDNTPGRTILDKYLFEYAVQEVQLSDAAPSSQSAQDARSQSVRGDPAARADDNATTVTGAASHIVDAPESDARAVVERRTVVGALSVGRSDSAIGELQFPNESVVAAQIFAVCRVGTQCEVDASTATAGSGSEIIETLYSVSPYRPPGDTTAIEISPAASTLFNHDSAPTNAHSEASTPQTAPDATVESTGAQAAAFANTEETGAEVMGPDGQCGYAENMTQSELTECAIRDYEVADKELNLVYREVMSALPAEGRSRLREEQREWVRMRDPACKRDNEDEVGGSMWPMLFNQCLAGTTKARVLFLRAMVDKAAALPSAAPALGDAARRRTLDSTADEIFYGRHPDLRGQRLPSADHPLAREWQAIRDCEAIVNVTLRERHPELRGGPAMRDETALDRESEEIAREIPTCQAAYRAPTRPTHWAPEDEKTITDEEVAAAIDALRQHWTARITSNFVNPKPGMGLACSISFVYQEDGNIGDIVLKASSGYSAFDRAAMKATVASAPLQLPGDMRVLAHLQGKRITLNFRPEGA